MTTMTIFQRAAWLLAFGGLALPTALAQRSLSPLDPSRLPPLEPGISVRIFDVGEPMGRVLWPAPGQTPNLSFVHPRLDLRDGFGPDGTGDFGIEDHFVTVVDGFLRAPKEGRYVLRLISDDGSQLRLGGELIVDHDGLHGPEPMDGEVHLAEGWYPLEVIHFEETGGALLRLEWRPPGAEDFAVVPTESLWARHSEVRVTSPGAKRLVRPLPRGRAGDGESLAGVHPSYRLESARPPGFEPRVGGFDWLADGRLVLCTWDGDVFVLEGVGRRAPEQVRVRRIAKGLAEPLGLAVMDGRIFVLQKQELTELIDESGDGRTDFYRVAASGWDVSSNFHEFAFGLAARDGLLYANLAIAIDPGGASTKDQLADRGSVLEIHPGERGGPPGTWRIVARGLRTPNGIGLGDDGHIYLTDNQGDWLPVSKVLRLEEGAFYSNRSVLTEEEIATWQGSELVETPPVVWLPQGEIGNSPGEITALRHGPYSGQLVHADVTHGGLKRVFVEEVGGMAQGTVFRFTQGLEAGSNRVREGPDGALLVGGLGSTGNWGQEGKQRFGLERLVWTGEPTFEPLSVRTLANGLDVELTEPLPVGVGWDPDAVTLVRYRYEPSPRYGGPKLDESFVPVLSSSVFEGRRRLFLEVDRLDPGFVYHLRLSPTWVSEGGRRLWTTESWTTVNRVPLMRREPLPNAYLAKPNTLTEAQERAGWRLLFDGEAPERHWRGFRRTDLPAGWRAVDGTLARVGPGGDIVTRETYSDFELELDWQVASGGNSGIFWRVSEEEGAVWLTGPEMQILDNRGHPDGREPSTSAGSDYALYAPSIDATRPVGAWNRARIRVAGDQVRYWLNGELIVEYRLGSTEWRERVAASKFRDLPRFGRMPEGHIALQDHGDPVRFRNVRIRRL